MTMDTKTIEKLAAFFDDGSRAYWRDADSFSQELLDQIRFDSEADMRKFTDIALCALKSDKRNISFVEFLISKGFDVNYKLEGDDCLLLKYIKDEPDFSVIKKLADLGADIYSETLDGDNALSILAGQTESVAVEVAQEYDLTQFDAPDSKGMTPLMHAAMNGFDRLAKLLIDQGFDVNGMGGAPADDDSDDIETDGVTPLALAIRFGNADTVKLLLEAGADEALYDAESNPPIFSLLLYPPDFFFSFAHRASGGRGSSQENMPPIFKDKLKILSMLEQPDLSNDEGHTLLMKCFFPTRDWRCGHRGSIMPSINETIALELIEKGADVNAISNDGKRPLHQAVVNMEQITERLLEAGADINAQDNDGNTPLHAACTDAEEETVIRLLKAGADYEIQNNDGQTPQSLAMENGYSRALELMRPQGGLLNACKNNQKRTVQMLLKNGGEDVNRIDELGNTALIYACRHNARDIVRLLLSHHADPNIANGQNHVPLHFAAQAGSSDIITLLMNAGADPNRTDDAGLSPLMLLAKSGKAVAAQNLIKNPAVDVSLKDGMGRTAVEYAIFAGQQQIAKALVSSGAVNTDATGNTTLHYACYYGYTEIAKILIEKDRDAVNQKNSDGETPLMLAARKSKLVAAKLLLEEGSETDCANLKGLIPLHLAAYNGDVPMGKTLLEAGADINARTQDGQTPLMYAIISEKGEFAEMLLAAGAEVNILDKKAQSALYYATEANLLKTIELLLAQGAES